MDLVELDIAFLNEVFEEEIDISDDELENRILDDRHTYSFNSENKNSDPVNTNEFFQPKRLEQAAEEEIKLKLLHSEGWKHLSAKREYVNSLTEELKYSLWNRILTDENLELKIRVESLEVFLDERTTFFSFKVRPECCVTIMEHYMTGAPCLVLQTILQLIPILAPNIETLDFTNFNITSDLKEDFKFLLKTCTKLKSLRLNSAYRNCPIVDLISTHFNHLDKKVQMGLQAIKTYYLFGLFFDSRYALDKLSNIFIRLPNLESLGPNFPLGPIMNHHVKFHGTLLNLTYIHDCETNLSTLEIFEKFCPKLKSISIYEPKPNVVKNLHKLSLLTEIKLIYFDNSELINYLTRNGKKIKKLRLVNYNPKIDVELLRQLCPKLKNYTYGNKIDEAFPEMV